LGRKITGRIHKDASKVLKNVIFPIFRNDVVVLSIKYDSDIFGLHEKVQ